MTTVYDILVKKLDSLSNSNQISRDSLNNLKKNGLILTTEQLMEYEDLLDPTFNTFRYLLLFIKYQDESPKGPDYDIISLKYIEALSLIPKKLQNVVKPYLSQLYLGGLIKELNNTKDINELLPWIRVYGELKIKNIEIQGFQDALGTFLNKYIWEVIQEPELDIVKVMICVYVMTEAQLNRFDLGELVFLIVSSVYVNLNVKYEMYKGGAGNDYYDIRKLVGYLKRLTLKSESEKGQVRQLEEFFGFDDSSQQQYREEEQKKIRVKEKKFSRDPNLQYKAIDFSTMQYIECIYTNVRNPRFSVNIYYYRCSVNGDVALKVYEFKDPSLEKTAVITEIDILETLSQHATPESAHLKFYGSYWDGNKIYIAMEYHNYTLMQIISNYKASNQKLSPELLFQITEQLIDAFADMENLGVYHQDIKPHNILVTNQGKVKIIDFSVSEFKLPYYDTLAATGVYFIQGTQGYMAPELQEHYDGDRRQKVKYRKNKADVFSLGLTILQMYSLDELYRLNYRESHGVLMDKVNQVEHQWLRTLLNMMLQLEFRKRPSFKECKRYLPVLSTIDNR